MYLRNLDVTGMKLLRDVRLSFEHEGRHRGWTVLIGRNGTGKSTILQAIALAAIGSRQVNALADASAEHLRDRRSGAPQLDIFARFAFSDRAIKNKELPGLDAPSPNIQIVSSVWQGKGSKLLAADSHYFDGGEIADKVRNPLDRARDEERPLWFVAGYGPSRYLPDGASKPNLAHPPLARLRPLFAQGSLAISTTFIDHFAATDKPRALRYVKRLADALFSDEELLPGLTALERAGKGGVTKAAILQDTPRFVQKLGGTSEKIPAVALGHGFQSTIAWIADLVGHVILEAEQDIAPEDMRGLVLVDEIDLYLHPTWQVRFVRALKKTFPKLQFVVTTHSPLMLASLDPTEDQVVQLSLDQESGDVKTNVVPGDPRVLTAAELLQTYFELDSVHPGELGRLLTDYRYLASNPYRTDDDDRTLKAWEKKLRDEGIDPAFEPVTRREFRRAGT